MAGSCRDRTWAGCRAAPGPAGPGDAHQPYGPEVRPDVLPGHEPTGDAAGSTRSDNPNLPKIPFFENMWSHAAGNGLTATQVWARRLSPQHNPGDFSNTLNNADNGQNCNAGGTLLDAQGNRRTRWAAAPGSLLMSSTRSFPPWRRAASIGLGDYHAMQWTVRKRLGGLLFDLNYTCRSRSTSGRGRSRCIVESDGHRTCLINSGTRADARGLFLRHDSPGECLRRVPDSRSAAA